MNWHGFRWWIGKNLRVYCCVFIERKPGGVLPSYDSIRKASLDRPKSGTPEKWDGYNSEDFGLVFDNFRPVTLTVSSFYKQVKHQSRSVFVFFTASACKQFCVYKCITPVLLRIPFRQLINSKICLLSTGHFTPIGHLTSVA